jgi:hypothetical protein
MPITKAHDRYMKVLLERIAEDEYPSAELMDRVEILLDEEHVDTYVAILFSKIESCHYPSKALLDRLSRWTLAAS